MSGNFSNGLQRLYAYLASSIGLPTSPAIVRRGFLLILFPVSTLARTPSMLRRLRCPLCVEYFYKAFRLPSLSPGISLAVYLFFRTCPRSNCNFLKSLAPLSRSVSGCGCLDKASATTFS